MPFSYRLVVLVVASVGLIPGLARAQSDINACVNPAGQMRILAADESCRPLENLVSWGVQGPAGPAGPKGDPGTSGPVVVDAAGARLGFYLSPLILMTADNLWFSVLADRNGFSNPSLGMFFAFLTDDCSGSRYGSGAGGGLVPNAQVLGGYAWLADLEAPPVIITGTPEVPGIYWFQQINAAGPMGPCTASAVMSTVTLYPMRNIDVSGFTPPFRLTN